LVPNHDGRVKGYLDACLSSILKSGERVKAVSLAAMVVDDFSSDSSEELILGYVTRTGAQTFPFHYLQTGKNIDVAGVYDLGMSRILSSFPHVKYIMTLDSDTVIDRDMITSLIDVAESSGNHAGMFATNQYFLENGKKTTRHRSTGHYVTPDGDTWDRDYNDIGTGRERILCPCLSGGLLKVSMIRDVGMILPEYKHYHTCTELGLRAQIRGWGVEYVEKARMWHAGLRPTERDANIEVPRIWNILRFFPRSEIERSIEQYEKGATDKVEKERLHRYVEAARRTCPPVYPMEKGKGRVFRQLIRPNGRPDV